MEQRELSPTLPVGMQNVTASLQNDTAVFYNVKNSFTILSSNSIPRYSS